MRDFIDKTSTQTGTPVNRENLMAIQGFEASTTKFNSDGSIVETNAQGQKLTVSFNSDGSIVEKFVGDKTITLTTKFNDNGTISGVIS